MENNYMDKLVRDALGDYEMSFPASDWDEMEQRLDRSDSMRRKLYVTKGIEVCLMVFAIWTAVHWVQSDITTTNLSTNQAIEQQLEQSPTPMVTPILSTEEANSSEEATPNSEETIESNKASIESTPIAQTTRKTPSSWTTIEAKLEEKPVLLNNQSNDLPIESENYTTNKKSSIINNAELEKVNVEHSEKVFAFNNLSSIPTIRTELLKTDYISLDALKLENPLAEVNEEASVKSTKNRKFRLGFIASMDWFNIRTPDIVAVNKEPEGMAFGGGLSFDIKLNDRIRLESGVLGTQRKHTESSVSTISFNVGALTSEPAGAIGERVDLQTTTLEIPLNVKYELADKNKTSVYALGGVSNHLIMTIQNTLFEKNLSNQQDNYTVNIQTAGRGSVAEAGLADQGLLNNNYFISLNAGLGIEHQLTDRLSVFAQASYKHGVGAVGRHDDQISSVSVATGMRGAL